jgi:hypothetical protein
MKLLSIAAMVAMLLVAGAALAQEVVYQKHTVVDFGADEIQGKHMGPDNEMVIIHKNGRLKNLINVRTSFREEILQALPK